MDKIGSYKQPIQIQTVTESSDANGDIVKVWGGLASRFAKIKPLSGRELEHAKQIQAEVTHQINLRYLAGVTAQSRIVFNSRLFEVLSVLNIDEANKELQILAKEITGVSAEAVIGGGLLLEDGSGLIL